SAPAGGRVRGRAQPPPARRAGELTASLPAAARPPREVPGLSLRRRRRRRPRLHAGIGVRGRPHGLPRGQLLVRAALPHPPQPDLRRDDAGRLHQEPQHLRAGADQVSVILPLLVAFALAGCAGFMTPSGPPRQSFVETQRARAEALERDGALRPALDAVNVGLTVEPADRALRESRARLQARIERGVLEQTEAARTALARRSSLEARRHFLAVLALDPANAAAFDGLRNEVKEVRFVTHTVRPGESLGSIAQRYYGDRSRSEVIWEMNQLPRNPRLAVGASLRVPEIPGVPFLLTPREGGPTDGPRATPPREDVAPESDPLLSEARDAFERNDLLE